jgi:lipoprotein-releasing system permease protein
MSSDAAPGPLALEARLARRYLRARTDNRFVSFIAGVGMLGIALSVGVLIVVLSVMNGFESELKHRILAMTPHATLSGLDGALNDWPALAQRLESRPGISAVAPYVENQAMLVAGRHTSGALVRGIDPKQGASAAAIGQHLTAGTLAALTDGQYRIVLGRALAAELGVALGDTVVLIAPKANATPAGVVPRLRRFTIAGVFSSGMYDVDRNVAFVSLGDAQRLYRMGEEVTGLELRLTDPYHAPGAVREAAVDLGGGFYISDWTRSHANFFRSIALTKSILFIALLLIMAVAAFNIVSTLVMLVREKRSDIAILRTMGLAPRGVLAIFVMQGSAIGLAGTAAGIALGYLVARYLTAIVHGLERLLGTKLIDARVYFIDELPARVESGDVMVIGLIALALCVLATLYPAAQAARTQPAAALRHD